MRSFTPLAIRHGVLLRLDTVTVWGWTGKTLELPAEATCYGMVTRGAAVL